MNYNPANRGPLLLAAGEEDRITTAASIRKNFSLYRPSSRTVTEFKAFPGRTHWIIAQDGWEEVAGYAFDWLYDKLDLGLSPPRIPCGERCPGVMPIAEKSLPRTGAPPHRT
ncbi:pimeloyl-ACP methyl ester carboxylesterase [Paenibacillus mucilaginosus]